MLPLAQIISSFGTTVRGSDRGRDQGLTPKKFLALEEQGIRLFPQDGSGITSKDQILVTSAAVEETVPEVKKAKKLGCLRLSRAELNSILFNNSGAGIAVAGTSGKSTVTGMLGWILTFAGRNPTIMNGAVMKDFVTRERPYASSVIGGQSIFLSEVDESDGSIDLYRPAVGILLNVSLDHKAMDELRVLFGSFLKRSRLVALNSDDLETVKLLPNAEKVITFGVNQENSQIGVVKGSIADGPTRQAATVIDRHDGSLHSLVLQLPGRHNLSNAMAAIAGASCAGIPTNIAVEALASFSGLKRRFDIVGKSAKNIMVIDDFGHNPEKCRATLKTLKTSAGRIIAFFQPHGFGPLKQMGNELADAFTDELDADDIVIMCDPLFLGGSVDRTTGTEPVIKRISEKNRNSYFLPKRKDCGEKIMELVRAGDRVIIMGARDDTLSAFANSIMERINSLS